MIPSARTRIVLKALITIAIFAVLVSRLDMTRLAGLFSRVNPLIFGISFLIFVSRNIFGALRNKVLLDRFDCGLSIGTLIRYYFIGFFFNMFLPTVVGGDIARGYYLYRGSGNRKETISTIIVERVLGIFAMMFLSVTSILLARIMGMDVFGSGVVTVVFTMFATGFAAMLLLFHNRMGHVFERILPHGIAQRFSAPLKVLSDIVSFKKEPVILAAAFGLSVVFQFLSIVSTCLIAVSLGNDTAFVYFLILLPVIWLASMLPFSINGLGLREGAFVVLFGAVGMAGETAMAVSLLWLGQTIALGIIGGIVFLLEGGSVRAIREYGTSH